jgi:hypothetical protein
MMRLANQSTIYRGHEARLARSAALQDDTRPAMLRVLSLLPVFCLIVPPFEPPRLTLNHHHQGQTIFFSEETIFRKEC